MLASVALASVALLVAQATAPSPTPSPLKTIAHVRSSPLCSTLGNNVFHTIQGLRINDKLIDNSRPLLLAMGKAFVEGSSVGHRLDQQQAQWGNTAGGLHDTNPAVELNAERLGQLIGEIVHNLDIIDGTLKDPNRFPAQAQTDADKKAMALKAQLQAVADQQRKNLNVLNGLVDTFSLQDLIAKGDGTLGAINDGGAKQVSHNDQDVSFQDVISGVDRGRSGHTSDPTLTQDPAITQAATDLTNNPMAPFYVTVVKNEEGASQAENTLAQTVVAVVNSCRQ
jgi:hypothetical protein